MENSPPPRKPRFPLWLKLAILTALLATVPLGAVGLVLIDINAHAVEHLQGDTPRSVVRDDLPDGPDLEPEA